MDEQRRARILVVEDEQIVSLDLVGRLDRLGYEVVATAATGPAAIARAEEHRPDLVLMDVKLAGPMDGIAAAARIQETMDAPVVYLTAFGDEATLARAKATGCYGYLLKPFEERELEIVIEVALFRHHTTRRIEEREAWLAATLGGVTEGVVASDAAGKVILVNAAAEAIVGLSADAARGRDAADVIRLAPGEDTPAPPWAAVAPQQVLTAGDGSTRHVEARAAPIRDKRGKPIGSVWVIRDVGERRRVLAAQHLMTAASAELSASLEDPAALDRVLGLAVPALADAALLHLADDEGGPLRLEAAACASREGEGAIRDAVRRVAGGAPEAARVGAPVVSELPAPDALAEALGVEAAPALAALAARAILSVPLPARGQVIGALTLIAARPGRRFDDLDAALAAELGRRIAVAVDNGRLYRDARRAVRMRDAALSVVSHDLRNALGVVIGAAELIVRGGDLAQAREHAQRIHRADDRMVRLVSDLLDAARLEDGRMTLSLEPCAAGELVAEAIDAFEIPAAQKAITLTAQVACDAPVLCDRARVHQVLANLLGNAVKFTPRGGAITVRAALDGAARFTIADTGPGVAPEQVPHVFDRYWQAPEAAPQGTGLGLHIARGLVELHGGRIWVESRPGAGSAFCFTLPLAAPAEAAHRAAA
jgi:signal transduction histidine kinase/AmiR/NasT family two-component response regulator